MKKQLIIIAASAVLIIITALMLASSKKDRVIPVLSYGCFQENLSGIVTGNDIVAYFEGKELGVPEISQGFDELAVLSLASEERWIEVDLSEQKLRAWEGNKIFLETSVSTGLPVWPTPTGEFRIWIKLRSTKMEGGSGQNYYYLPNVPYVMYFENEQVPGWRGYGLHGTYWHNDFGNQRSHGCVNLPTPVAKEIYYWAAPTLTEGKSVVHANENNQGTRIVIHE